VQKNRRKKTKPKVGREEKEGNPHANYTLLKTAAKKVVQRGKESQRKVIDGAEKQGKRRKKGQACKDSENDGGVSRVVRGGKVGGWMRERGRYRVL